MPPRPGHPARDGRNHGYIVVDDLDDFMDRISAGASPLCDSCVNLLHGEIGSDVYSTTNSAHTILTSSPFALTLTSYTFSADTSTVAV